MLPPTFPPKVSPPAAADLKKKFKSANRFVAIQLSCPKAPPSQHAEEGRTVGRELVLAHYWGDSRRDRRRVLGTED